MQEPAITSSQRERVDYLLEMGKEQAENAWRTYQEPKLEGSSSLAASTSAMAQTQIEGDELDPLPQGTLLENLSIPVVIVVTKVSSTLVLQAGLSLKYVVRPTR